MAFRHEGHEGFRAEERRGGFERAGEHRGWFGGMFGRREQTRPGERRGWWGRWFGRREVIHEPAYVAPPAEVAPPIEIGTEFGHEGLLDGDDDEPFHGGA